MQCNNLYIFPTSRAIREYIASLKQTNQLLPKYITIGDFFSRILLTNNKTIIDKDLRILYLKEAIKNVALNKLGLSSNFSKFYKQSEYIFKFFNELNSEFKNIDDLHDADSYALYSDHLDVLKKIYKTYVAILDKNNFVDNITLPNNFTINENYINEFDNITLYYEGYFSSFEFSIIEKVAKVVNVTIEVLINEFNSKNIELFKKIDIDLEVNNKYVLDITNKKILEQEEFNKVIVNNVIYPVSQRINQIAVVKHTITQMIKDGYEAKDIYVLLPDESFSDYLKLFDDEKYFNFAMGKDIEASYTFKRVNSLISFLNNNEPKDTIKLHFNDLDIKYIEENIKKHWQDEISEDIFMEIIDYLTIDENNNDIKEKILEIKLTLKNLLFSKKYLEMFEEKIILKDAFKIFVTKLQEISLDDVAGGAVTVLGILETRYIQPKAIIVVDFNDDKIPKRSVKDKFLSSIVKSNASLPTLTDRQNLQKYYYKRLFDGASSVVLTYVHDEQNTISRFSKQIFLKQNIQYKDFSKVMNNSNEFNIFNENIEKNIDLSKLEWSATSLKIFLDCKRKYYFSYIKKIKEHNILLKPAAYEIGQILHDVLEKYYKQENRTLAYLQNEITSYQGKNPYLTLDLELWKIKLEEFIKKEETRFADGISVHSLEQPFNIEYNGVRIKGKIDRIDKNKDNTYTILDYKTSSTLKIDTSKTYINSNDFQLEFYALASRDVQVSQVAYYDLNDASIKEEIMLEEKIQRLNEVFLSLKTTKVNFLKCEDKKACTFCTYKIICNRE